MLCEGWTLDRPIEEQIRQSNEMVFTHDSVRLVYVSEPLAAFLGYAVEEMEGRLIVSFLSASAFVAMIQTISKNRVRSIVGKHDEFEPRPTRLKNKQGDDVVLQAMCSMDIPASAMSKAKMRLTVLEAVQD
ncbi:MAG: hypothetical protein JXK16_02405 [Thiotrichales bacterium]|nr:hypothetical protein [Thiotrichales bacterium]